MSYIHLKENSLNPLLKEDKILGLVFFFFLNYCMLSVLVLEVLCIAELL